MKAVPWIRAQFGDWLTRSALIGSALLALGCNSTPPAVQPLQVACDLDNPPFADLDAGGVAVGRDVEMMEELGRRLGRPIEWERLSFERLLPAVVAKDVDLACATLGITEVRARRVLFSRPYFQTALAVVVRVGEGEPIALEHLQGRKVYAGAGTTSEDAVRSHLSEAHGVFEAKEDHSSLEMLHSREVDALVMDAPNAEAIVEASNGRLACLPQNLARESYGLALPKQATALKAELDAAIEDLEREGWMLLLDARYQLVDVSSK